MKFYVKSWKIKSDKRGGFTIAELIVAMGVFLILLSIATGSFIQILRTQRATVSLLAANANASLAMEQISREIRTGGVFSLSNGELHFTNSKNEPVIYKVNSATEKIERSNDGITFNEMTADNVKVKSLTFVLFAGAPGNQYPTRITVNMRVGASGVSFSDAVVNLQTTISARVLQ